MAEFCDVVYRWDKAFLRTRWWIEATGPLGRVATCCEVKHGGDGSPSERKSAVAEICNRLIGQGWEMYATGQNTLAEPYYAKLRRG